MVTTSQAQPDVIPVAPIVEGRKDYLSVLLRLIGMDLYKMRRRRLSKMLLLVGTLVVALVFVGLGVAGWYLASKPLSSFVPPQCVGQEQGDGCLNHPATQADEQQYKDAQLSYPAQNLYMPGVWGQEEPFLILMAVLGIILAGGLVGGEYSLGTIRLQFTRGPTRLQFLLAKVVALALCVVPTILFLTLLATVIGLVMGPLTGLAADYRFLTAAWVGHFALFLLVEMLYWYSFMLMALFFGTVGRSTVVGVAGPLIWLGLEPVLTSILTALANTFGGSQAGVLRAIPGYFLGNNLTSLLDQQGHVIALSSKAGDYPVEQSLLVVAAYLVVFVGVAGALTVRRDVTH